jgi:hypothetical protein
LRLQSFHLNQAEQMGFHNFPDLLHIDDKFPLSVVFVFQV